MVGQIPDGVHQPCEANVAMRPEAEIRDGGARGGRPQFPKAKASTQIGAHGAGFLPFLLPKVSPERNGVTRNHASHVD